MRVIALLSGGKDSVAAIDVARSHGWDVVCALVLRPAEDDAWMFHCPNIDVARGVGEAMGLPVSVVPVRAGPDAEVADLESALRDVATQYDADGIVSGALASEYQRTRIDAIGHRLGLRTFAPLWHVAPEPYFRGLIAGGYDVRMVRTAADGLDESWLGRRLTTGDLDALAAKRLHVAGEGGEFETIVLDGPGHQRPAIVDDAEVEASASRATWHIRRWHLGGPDHDHRPDAHD